MRIRANWIKKAMLVAGLIPAIGTTLAQETGKKPSSYSPVVVQEDFASVMSRMRAAKPAIMQRQKTLLEERYDLSDRPAVGLALGTLSEEIAVSANATQVDTQSSAVGTVVDNRRIISLPLNGRDAHTDSPARIPRISRLMALAIKFQEMIHRGEVRDYADLARLGYVTRARITQIMNLLNLAPDIQEEVLDLAASVDNRAPAERQIRSITKIVPWTTQRRAWSDSRDENATGV